MAKISVEQICKIPSLLKEGYTISAIGRLYDVNPVAIRYIIQAEKWKDYTSEVVGTIERCPGCGGKVVNDLEACLVCELRNKPKKTAIAPKLVF